MKQLGDIYEQIQPKLYTFFYIKTANASVAEDLTQDVFYEAMKSIHRFNGQSSISTWLFAIAHHLLAKYYRSNRYKRTLHENFKQFGSPSHPLTTEQQVELQESAQTLLKNINALDTPGKEIVLLRIYGDCSFKEIGEMLGKSENYVRVTFHRLKLKLQQEMEGAE
ncbi:sigma-70 family RNA polymerase sigma factor [Solibacillus sp. CAU 1738]|uniref:RNA polymerase sigma factor n=1 Tax=Solibacillus sp. CAU 1738 TaxID=3140363 RepID=UPI003261A81C